MELRRVVSCVQVHLAWIKTPRNKGGLGHMKIPILADTKKACSLPCILNVLLRFPKRNSKTNNNSTSSSLWISCCDTFHVVPRSIP